MQTSDHFEQLPSVLFAHVCSFLDLQCKCWRFPVLSHRSQTAFEPAACCCEVRLQVVSNLSDINDSMMPHQIRVSSANIHSISSYLRCASSIQIEWYTSNDMLFNHVKHQLTSLHQLQLFMERSDRMKSADVLHWNALANCKALKTLRLGFSPSSITVAQQSTISIICQTL